MTQKIVKMLSALPDEQTLREQLGTAVRDAAALRRLLNLRRKIAQDQGQSRNFSAGKGGGHAR
jgi:hypothetical protein